MSEKLKKHNVVLDGNKNPQNLADLLYYKQFGKRINWLNPRDLNEKINWLAFNTDTTIWTLLSDKYLVRDYLILNNLSHILPNLYGVWENVEDIDFERLPNEFVLKCNHDAGSVILVKNKLKCNLSEIKAFLKGRISEPFGITSAEPHYFRIKRLILAEELIENDSEISESIIDYKFWSFYGKTDYCLICCNTTNWLSKKSGIYNIKTWTLEKSKMINNERLLTEYVPKPNCLGEMLDIIYRLTKNFPQCRVDLYESRDKVYFGELTFTSGAGRITNYSSDFLLELGNKTVITKKSTLI